MEHNARGPERPRTQACGRGAQVRAAPVYSVGGARPPGRTAAGVCGGRRSRAPAVVLGAEAGWGAAAVAAVERVGGAGRRPAAVAADQRLLRLQRRLPPAAEQRDGDGGGQFRTVQCRLERFKLVRSGSELL
jgi:hypothetical protein